MIKAGFVQLMPLLGNKEETIKKISSFESEMASTDLVVLPELCNSGYNFVSKEQAFETSEIPEKSIFVEYLVSVCKKYNCHIVSGINERDGDVIYNSAVLVSPKGIVGKYRKTHLFDREKDFFTPGNLGFPVFDIGICRVGMLVCFDWIFPESWRMLALQKADVVCHAANLVIPEKAQKSMPACSIMNKVFIVTANRIGTERDLTFTGRSQITDTNGQVLYQAQENKEEAFFANLDISLARNKKMTDRNDLFGDRRTEFYSLITEKQK